MPGGGWRGGVIKGPPGEKEGVAGRGVTWRDAIGEMCHGRQLIGWVDVAAWGKGERGKNRRAFFFGFLGRSFWLSQFSPLTSG